jgi:hypothetical protein
MPIPALNRGAAALFPRRASCAATARTAQRVSGLGRRGVGRQTRKKRRPALHPRHSPRSPRRCSGRHHRHRHHRLASYRLPLPASPATPCPSSPPSPSLSLLQPPHPHPRRGGGRGRWRGWEERRSRRCGPPTQCCPMREGRRGRVRGWRATALLKRRAPVRGASTTTTQVPNSSMLMLQGAQRPRAGAQRRGQCASPYPCCSHLRLAAGAPESRDQLSGRSVSLVALVVKKRSRDEVGSRDGTLE